MNKVKLVKRGQIQEPRREIKKASTVTIVKDWINTRHQSTKHSAREAFDLLFTTPQQPCQEC